ncbi:MAG: CHAP domain-containing protein [Chloroflexi bacterium]|nr:MAG: CHAP domain-containing protein [Chloroflexota bacterium]
MTLLHMETDLVRNMGDQLHQTSVSLQDQTQTISHSIQTLSGVWQGASATIFIGEIQPLMQALHQLSTAGETLNKRLQQEVDEWERIASSSLNKTVLAAMGLPLTGGGLVLGTNTSNFKESYLKLPWSGKFDELQTLEQNIASLEQELANQNSVDGRISEIDEEIARLETQVTEAQDKADVWYNKVVPTLPFSKDDDGVPWRVRTDNYEDEIAGYEQQINELRSEKDSLLIVQGKQQQLAQLNEQHDTLQTIITDGISADGPAKKYDAFPGTITNNCTKHASAKRFFPDAVNGHAYKWNEQAKSAGYEVGDYPVKGSVMVYEPGVKGAHNEFGHVAFVEKVEPMSDGQYKVTFTDNNHPDPKLCEEYGVPYQKASWPNYQVIRPGETGISYIYD